MNIRQNARFNGFYIGKTLLVGIAALTSLKAQALTAFGSGVLRESFVVDGDEVYLHPYTAAPALEEAAGQLRLFDSRSMDFQSSVKAAVQAVSRDLDSMSILKMEGTQKKTGFGLTDGHERIDFKFSVGGVPVCGYDLVAHRTSSGKSIVMGVKPKITDTFIPPASDWSNVDDVRSRLYEQIHSDYSTPNVEPVVKTNERCFLVQDGHLIPVWNMSLDIGGLLYRGWADAYTVYHAEPQFFSATGTANVYVENSKTGSLTDVTLSGLVDSSTYLINDTIESYPIGQTKASNSSRKYNYATSSAQFSEVSAFTHASRHMEFFKSLGYTFSGSDKIYVVTHATPNGTENNALYQPKESSQYDRPTIMIGDGDGVILQNLPMDGDVASHELGHHIVFEYLKSISGASLTMHEALADFFTFSRTGDACLGESICPTDSKACWTPKTCLRSGETTLKITDTTNPNTGAELKDGHIRGQVVSGMLWDMRKAGSISGDDLTKLVFKAISYLRATSGFRDLLLALFSADLDLYDKKYAQVIYDAAVARGFSAYISDVNVSSGSYPSLGTDTLTTTSTTEEGSDDNKSKKFIVCGVAAGDYPATQSLASQILALILVLIPVALSQRSRLRPVRVKSKSRKS